MSNQIKKSTYRQRIYQTAEGAINIVFGSDAAPEGQKLLADHDISEVVVVSDHVEVLPDEKQAPIN